MPNGSEVLLGQLEAQGVDCVFASPIAVMAPIWEVLARRADDRKPRYFRCRHELLAVSLASGYYKATGRSQIVFLPSSLGVQNGSMGLHTALQERTPMTVLSPDTLSYGEDPSADPGPEWPSLLVDLVGPARNAEAVVKWAKRARTASELVHELRRACLIAESVPRGPTLLEIPFDLLVGTGHDEIPDWVTPAPVVASEEQIDQAAQILADAQCPLVITEHGGRTDESRDALVRIAEALSAPVFEFMSPAYHNFPRSHPLYGAGPVEAVLGEASEVDAILLAGCNAPWHPPHPALRPGCAVIHAEEDPLRPRAAYWGYPTTHTIPGDLARNLRALAANLGMRSTPRPDAVQRWSRHSQAVRAKDLDDPRQSRSQPTGFVPAAELFRQLHDALPDDAICVDEIIAQVPHMIQFLFEHKPIRQYRGWAGALGTSLGTALGIKLAQPQQLVVSVLGDGAWHYNPVPAALGFSQEYSVPLLIVLCNNRGLVSQTWNVLRYFPDSEAVRDRNFVGDVISPTPDYVKVAQAYGGDGERVDETAKLRPALQRALDVVAAGQTFLLDVLVNP
ncbi:Benzoylformate decarboxylase [Mycobacterium simulans]|uniref:acetolactate synthase n=1 Tax=Mycobacterium simulans TaxID=627089 RepID=A0A7Z7N888_9MYCO|nr:thiamine pyrophosphate-dependent enzyme [Mycobacterium simulans]SOJ53349.1 Benzoylformate decarboxylase [Mycobacterium simulans]